MALIPGRFLRDEFFEKRSTKRTALTQEELVHGQKSHDFLTRLVGRGYATVITPGALHRGRLFHVQYKPLYEAIGELLTLQWTDVSLARDEMTIRAENAKDREDRTIPISSRLRRVLEARRHDAGGRPFPPSAYVFGNEVGRRVGSVKRAWQTTVLKAHGHQPVWIWTKKKGPNDKGTTKLSPESQAAYRSIDLHFHDLRHEGGSRLLEAGWPAPCSAHAGPCVAATDQHVPQRHAPRVARIHANPGAIPRGLQVSCKQTRPRPPACSQTGSRQKREVLASLIVMVGGVDGTRTLLACVSKLVMARDFWS